MKARDLTEPSAQYVTIFIESTSLEVTAAQPSKGWFAMGWVAQPSRATDPTLDGLNRLIA
ncbi:hypothetical protein Ct61P_15495 [Colletotrichum tofieldiae]|nr:hypothetical protein Ct61P_15495 [Colletotrichum tofieldiae]